MLFDYHSYPYIRALSLQLSKDGGGHYNIADVVQPNNEDILRLSSACLYLLSSWEKLSESTRGNDWRAFKKRKLKREEHRVLPPGVAYSLMGIFRSFPPEQVT